MNNEQATKFQQEEIILRGLRQGEEASYRALFEHYYPVLVTFALRYVTDLDQAKELVQEVFIKLYQKREALQIAQSLKSYLFKAVYHQCLNTIKQAKLRQQHQQQAAQERTDTDDTDHLVEAETIQRIYQAIETLPEQCRRIFTMNRFEGMNNQAIADQLGISKRTVETQISKALKLLRQALFLLHLFL